MRYTRRGLEECTAPKGLLASTTAAREYVKIL
jgi:hypothetical protein